MSGLLERWWEPPRPEARELARVGEIRASGVRLLVAVVGTVTAALATPFGRWEFTGGYAVMVVGGALLLALARRPAPPSWLNLVSCLFDVAVLAGINAVLVWSGDPLLAANSRVFFGVMLLFLTLTCLRLDPRLCLLSGVVTMGLYAAVVTWASVRYDLAGPVFAGDVSGVFAWSNQISRLVLLGVATGVNAEIVVVARTFWRDSIRDPLTGLHNRRYAEVRLDEELAAARRRRDELVLAIVDLDDLKAVNDARGHAAGDAALQTVADAMRRFFRTTDVVARFGGDEFLVVLPGTGLEVGLQRLATFRANVAAVAATGPYCTVSLGVALYPGDAVSAANLLRLADHRLYTAKSTGRNRAVAADTAPPPAQPLPPPTMPP